MRKSILELIKRVRPFVPVVQLKCLVDGLRGEERGFFREKLRELDATIAAMPVTYAQEGLGDEAVVHLHYFLGGADWWITEKDVDGGVAQAFGLVDMGHGPELGYIGISELVRVRGMDLDLHWKPVTLGELKAKRYGEKPKPKAAPKPAGYTVADVLRPADFLADAPADGLVH